MSLIYSKLSSKTGLTRAVREIINKIQGFEDSSGTMPMSFSFYEKKISELSAAISGLSSAVAGLQRLGLHGMSGAIILPPSGSTITNVVTVSGTFSDQSGHVAVSGMLYVSGIFHTGLTFPVSGYWNSAIDTSKFANGAIEVHAQIICTAGTSTDTGKVSYTVKNQIAAGGTSQAGEPGTYGDTVSLILSNPGVAAGSFVMTGSFYSSQGHALSSVSATSNTSAVTVSASFTGWGITLNCYADWSGGQQYAIITVSCVDVGGCVAQASVKVYSPYQKVGA